MLILSFILSSEDIRVLYTNYKMEILLISYIVSTLYSSKSLVFRRKRNTVERQLSELRPYSTSKTILYTPSGHGFEI